MGITLLVGCFTRGLPVAVDYADNAVHTQVDSELAHYYLSRYRQGERLRPQFDAIIEHTAQIPLQRLLERDVLAELAQRYSTDFATAVLIDRLRAVPSNRMADERFRALIASSATRDSSDPKHRYRILFVPGWAYRSRPHTGADLALPRQATAAAGFETKLVPTAEYGGVVENAQIIAQTLMQEAPEPVIIVSASKAGPEVAYCLGRLLSAENSRHVRAWVNAGGVLQGTALVDNALDDSDRFVPTELADLSTTAGRRRFAGLNFPQHLLVLNYVGIPFSGDVTRRARYGYRVLSISGPNDGLALTVDQLVPGAVTLIEPGVDHYFRDLGLGKKTVALTQLIVGWLEAGGG